MCVFVLVAQSFPTLCVPMDYSPPGSSVHGTFQARIQEWVAISFSRGSSGPRDQTQISCIAGGLNCNCFTCWATGEALNFFIRQSPWQPRDRTQALTLQPDSSPAEPPEKPKNTAAGSLSFTRESSQPRNRTGVSCIVGRKSKPGIWIFPRIT